MTPDTEENGRWKTGHTYCAVISVDIDRFTDSVLKRRWVHAFKLADGSRPTVEQLRAACADLRSKGFKAFPHCGHAGSDGMCVGVPTEVSHGG